MNQGMGVFMSKSREEAERICNETCCGINGVVEAITHALETRDSIIKEKEEEDIKLRQIIKDYGETVKHMSEGLSRREEEIERLKTLNATKDKSYREMALLVSKDLSLKTRLICAEEAVNFLRSKLDKAVKCIKRLQGDEIVEQMEILDEALKQIEGG